MKGKSALTNRDLILSHADLRRRIKNLLDGATPMFFYAGAYGLSTSWVTLRPLSGWHMTGGSVIRARLRSDVVYLHTTTRTGGIVPVSLAAWPTGPALQLPAKPHVFWPSYRVKIPCITSLKTHCTMTVTPNGLVYFSKPPKGRTLRPGAWSWPRG